MVSMFRVCKYGGKPDVNGFKVTVKNENGTVQDLVQAIVDSPERVANPDLYGHSPRPIIFVDGVHMNVDQPLSENGELRWQKKMIYFLENDDETGKFQSIQ